METQTDSQLATPPANKCEDTVSESHKALCQCEKHKHVTRFSTRKEVYKSTKPVQARRMHQKQDFCPGDSAFCPM